MEAEEETEVMIASWLRYGDRTAHASVSGTRSDSEGGKMGMKEN